MRCELRLSLGVHGNYQTVVTMETWLVISHIKKFCQNHDGPGVTHSVTRSLTPSILYSLFRDVRSVLQDIMPGSFESLEVRRWRMDKISWTDHVKN